MKYSSLIAAALLLAACSHHDTRQQVERLDKVQGEWTKAQTDEAIDLYLQGLENQERLMEENMQVLQQTGFFRKSKCDRSTLADRQDEIEQAEKRVDEHRARLIEKYSSK